VFGNNLNSLHKQSGSAFASLASAEGRALRKYPRSHITKNRNLLQLVEHQRDFCIFLYSHKPSTK